MPINLAFFKYRSLLKQNELIKKIVVRKSQINFEQEGYEALCHLSDKLSVISPSYVIHSSAHGMGTSLVKNVAIYKSISEALERWAYLSSKSDKANLRFDICPDSSGFAAFPGLTSKEAKRLALDEAFERWCLLQFWKETLPLSQIKGSKTNRLESYCQNMNRHFIILYTANESEPHAYGFSASSDKQSAIHGAMTELYRNHKTLNKFHELTANQVANMPLQEQRLLYFSKNEGYHHFNEKVQIALKLQDSSPPPKILFNSEVKGEWSKYAFVWRTVLDYPDLINSKSINVFKF